MVAWYQNPEYASLYDLCQRMGAPEFQSSREMLEWVRYNFDRIKGFAFEHLVLLGGLFDSSDVVVRYLAYVVHLYRCAIPNSVLKRANSAVKGFLNPVSLFPRSLHPIDAAA
jgi:hypothetical protein